MIGLFVGQCNSVEPHLLDGRQQTISSSRRKVLLEAYRIDEVEVEVDNLLRCAIAQSTNKQSEHTLYERFAPDVDGIKLSCVQFAASGTISCILMFIFETPRLSAILSAVVPLLYSGIMSCGLAYTFQIIGQKYTEATVASLIMCMESVFGVLGGAVLLHEILTGREIAGCVIMFVAIIFAQLSEPLTEKLKARKQP